MLTATQVRIRTALTDLRRARRDGSADRIAKASKRLDVLLDQLPRARQDA